MDAEVPRPMQADVRYAYDPAGNVRSIADTPQDAPADTQCFRYDHLRRLTDAWTPAAGCDTDPASAALAGPAPYRQSFTYDTVGNRLTESRRDAGGETTREYAYSAPGAHDLKSVTSSGPGGTKTDEYEYDAAGNTTRRPNQTLDWNPQGNLERVTEGGAVTEFVHDADGNRLIRRDPTGRTLYLDGQELRWDKATGKRTATRYYAYRKQTVAVRTAAGTTWLASDHQGTAQVAVDSGTQKVIQRRQTPFGEARGPAVMWPGEKGFVGGIVDLSTGLTHLGARDYDPRIGRFVSVDPVMVLTDPQQMHGYAYANNSPITFSDPTGLAPCSGPDGVGCGRDKKTQNFCGGPFCGPNGKQVEPTLGSDAPGGVPQKSNKSSGATGCGRGRGTCGGGGSVKTPTGKNIGIRPRSAPGPSFSDVGHFLLDGCGMVPLIGELCDGGNALWYLAEGDLLNAGISATGMIPAGGQAATGARMTTKVADGVKAGCSFDGDTAVLMADGTTKPIKDIKVGDKVLATDPETGAEGPRVVTHLWVHGDQLVDLELANGAVVTTTEDHPFWNKSEQQWQQAQELDRHDNLHVSGGGRVAVLGLDLAAARKGIAYNITVDDIHTYYVVARSAPLLVHNTCGHVNYDLIPEGLRPYAENVIRQMEKDGTLPPGVQQGAAVRTRVSTVAKGCRQRRHGTTSRRTSCPRRRARRGQEAGG